MLDRPDLDRALSGAAALLKRLPSDPHASLTARAMFRDFAEAHPEVSARLVADRRPGSDTVDHDILLTAPDGTLSLSWHRDRGLPWTTLYSDHWASNAVLTVDGAATTIQSALIYLNAMLKRQPDLMQDLIDRSLLWAAIEAEPLELDDASVDAAVIEFRTRSGLSDTSDLQRWLAEMQLTPEALRELVSENMLIRSHRQARLAGRVEPWFEAHQSDYERISGLLVRLPSLAQADALAAAWRSTGRCPALEMSGADISVEAQLSTFWPDELPAGFADAAEGAIVGPIGDTEGFWAGQVLKRVPAELDDETRLRIEALLFDQDLALRRRDATVRWHWI